MNYELRSYVFDVRAEQNEEHGHFIIGRPIVYNARTNLGCCDEVIEQGALDHADLRDVPFLVNHNSAMIPLARSRNNTVNSTMQLSVDDKGMVIRVDLDTENNAEAKSLYSAVSRGDISGMSILFTVEKDRWENLNSDHPLRHVERIARLFEVSAVTHPAYAQTSLEARGIAPALDSAGAALDSAKTEMQREQAEQRKRKIRILCNL